MLDKTCGILVEHFDAGIVIVTTQDSGATKNAFRRFGNDYAIEGICANIHDILYGQEDDDDDDLDDGDLKKAIKVS